MLSAIILIENLRWMVPTVFMLGAAPAYISVWGAWRLVSSVLPRWVYVKGDDFLFSTYHRNLLFFFEIITGVELIFYGDLTALKELAKGENCIYMSNHQSTLDWVIASCISMRRGSLGRTRYVLKDGLKFLPFYGFYLGMHGSLFVKRAGKFRKDKAEKQLSRDAHDKKPMWLVVFPEGTRFNPELINTIESSKVFATEQGLQPLENVLFPRIRAVQVCIEQLGKSVDSVYDVTIAYGNTYDFSTKQRLPAPPMQDFLMGSSPRVHIHINRIPISEVPVEKEELKSWLYSRFQLKDRLLEEFYSAESESEARFPGVRIIKPLSMYSLLPSVLLWSGTFAAFNSFRTGQQGYWSVGLGLACIGIFWMAVRP
ncbi:1-acyl-sn-glycerol-3-phosphate acyltransferase epsilon-like [Physella acuta]|uniref:1-acyl-sn-glycerol-3-phosphate acyltransferase epsilon-like n=1 Tax=Physella acuta TaxID=109671 RepID=UPI0027DD5045|nr:1-acyl-sn-glycerol-3-phosphate acyltransferase epsilon-like [Physella acuta]